jgi:hypothetical protein
MDGQGSMIEVVSTLGGQTWTVAVVRSNQWQSWRWVRMLDRLMDKDGSGSALPLVLMVLQLPALLPAAGAWLGYHLRGRRDVRLTVRAGRHSASEARRDALVDEWFPSKASAIQRAHELVEELRTGTDPGGTEQGVVDF